MQIRTRARRQPPARRSGARSRTSATARPSIRALRRPDPQPARGGRRPGGEPRAPLRLRGRHLDPGRDVRSAAGATDCRRPWGRGRHSGPLLARLPALCAGPGAGPRTRPTCGGAASTSISTPCRARSASAHARSSCATPPTRPDGTTHRTLSQDLGEVLRRAEEELGCQVTLVADETHRDFVSPPDYTSGAASYDRMRDRLLVREVPLHAGSATRATWRCRRDIPRARRSPRSSFAGLGSPASLPPPR